MKLLTVGGSLRAGVGQPGRFKLTGHSPLPAFGGKNYRRAAGRSDRAIRVEGPPIPTCDEVERSTTPEKFSGGTATIHPVPAADSPSVPESGQRAEPLVQNQPVIPEKLSNDVPSIERRKSKWLGFFTFLRSRRNPFRLKQTKRTDKDRLVQAELSLQSVRVVRNDLSDSDIQVVSGRKSRPRSFGDGERKATPGAALSRLTARLFSPF